MRTGMRHRSDVLRLNYLLVRLPLRSFTVIMARVLRVRAGD